MIPLRWRKRFAQSGALQQVVYLFLLTACACHPPQIPPHLAACPPGAATPRAPPVPRTFDSIVAWANQNAAALGTTQRALEVCRARLHAVVAATRQPD